MFKQLPDKINFAEIEKEILSFWNEDKVFEKSISTREGKLHFTFYEGPPTANGKPGIHHVMARTIKDLICRYKTLRGYQVYRKAGWDTQGLPVEIEVEKALGIKSKDDIEKLGVEKFNQACRDSVFKYLKEWEELTERMGYWVNFEDEYMTHKNEYIESVWWSLKKFFYADLIYRGYKIQPYCPRCETPLSSHEVALGYEDVKDPSVYITFKIKEGQGLDGYEFLVWTTTPWTLISNVALAVGPDVTYVKIQFKKTGDKVILAKDRLSVITQEYEILGEVKGRELENIEYEQLFPYIKPDKKAFYVTLGDFVTTEDGSGIVHIAPAFGEDDYQLSKKYNLPIVQPVDKSGKFTDEVTDFKGRFVKDADEDIIAKLKAEHKLYKKEKITHSYPHCWRCHTPLLYYARESWYIKTSSYKEKMIELNNQINWYPPETGSGRFGNWLEENRDWALSRDRYWGTPLPIWACTCEEGACACEQKYIVIGSIAELKEKAVNFKEVFPMDESLDLHKPYIDRIKILCEKGKCEMTRVEEVIDAWYDSGSMPFAQFHYMGNDTTPEGKLFRANYPADFIAEGIDQTRGWFYSLHAIGTFLFNEKAYKNLIVNDLILDKTGQKMSKHIGNIIDPFEIMEKYGADITRWYLMSSSPPWRPKMFNEDDLVEVRNKFFDTLINTYRFFVLYCNLQNVKREELTVNPIAYKRPEIDRWIISALNTLKKKYIELMDGYDITRAARAINDFTIDDLSNWYVRRNRRRFRNPEGEIDRLSAYQTLYEVLAEILKMVSPISPFLSEKLFKELTGEESVHLAHVEPPDENQIDAKLENEMKIAERIVYLVRSMRVQFNLKTRQPLKQMLVAVSNDRDHASIEKMKDVILEEVNIKELNFVDRNSSLIKRKAKLNFKTAGPKFGKDIKKVQQVVNDLTPAQVNELASGSSITADGFLITPEDVAIFTENIEGWVVESQNNLTVALDTKLDQELVNEGIAREFISKVQNIRKERSMDVNDKIKIRFTADQELLNAILNKQKYITEQTMAVELNTTSPLPPSKGDDGKLNGFEEVNINGRICKVSIEKV
ncbi:MAG TPA: isoleucine--tRNA ligase [Ignavibacteria bacterium]|jgi:isoleucyl-tRNA synthetase